MVQQAIIKSPLKKGDKGGCQILAKKEDLHGKPSWAKGSQKSIKIYHPPFVPPIKGNVIELRQNVSPFQGLNTIELYTQGCSPWAILCQPFGLYHMQKNFYPLIQRHCPSREGEFPLPLWDRIKVRGISVSIL